MKQAWYSLGTAAALAAGLTLLSGPALANDSLAIGANAFTPTLPTSVDPAVAVPLVYRDNGNITINYVVNNVFTTGTLGGFTLHLKNVTGSGQHGTFPVSVSTENNGNDERLSIVPTTTPLDVPSSGEVTTTVSVAINCGIAGNPCPTGNGDTLDRQLQFDDDDQHFDTGVKVHVIVTLVVPPTDECLAMANFVTDQGWTERVGSTEVVVIANGKNANTVRATTPFGQLSQDIAISSDCAETRHFDLKITLDPRWETNPNDNPGNAVFTYYTDEDIDLATYVPSTTEEKTPQGQNLCLANLWLDPGESLIALVHTQIQRGIMRDQLPTSPDEFVFMASIHEPNSTCGMGDTIIDADDAIVSYTTR